MVILRCVVILRRRRRSAPPVPLRSLRRGAGSGGRSDGRSAVAGGVHSWLVTAFETNVAAGAIATPSDLRSSSSWLAREFDVVRTGCERAAKIGREAASLVQTGLVAPGSDPPRP